MQNALIVGIGGFFGAILRYGINVFVETWWRGNFPLATFCINVAGSFALGFFATLAGERLPLDPRWKLLVATGFLGAFTTFSTFENETLWLATHDQQWWAFAYVAASVIIGFAAAWCGTMLAR